MNHQWRPRPMQGNICPTCSTSHFPFCPPLPNPRIAHGGPNFNPHFSMQQPIYSNTGEPYRDPHYWSRNPNNPGENFHNLYQFPQPFPGDPGVRGGYPTHSYSHGVNLTGSEYSSVNDRSSKRLRVDGPNLASYSTEAPENSSMILPNENERRLKLIRDHGTMNVARHDGSYAGVSGKRFQTDAYQYVQTASLSGGYHGYQHKTHGSNGFHGENLLNGFQHSEPHFDVHAHCSVEKGSLGSHPPTPYATGHFDKMNYGCPGRDSYTIGSQYGHPDIEKRGGYNNVIRSAFTAQPPLPTSPPPPPPPPPNPTVSASVKTSVALFPIQDKSSVATHCSFRPSEVQSLGQHYHPNSQPMHASRGLFHQDSPGAHASANQYFGEGQLFLSKTTFSDVSKAIDISNLFSMPHRVTRPDHFVIILRGLPGSGKSYLAKMLRDLEVEHGGSAPRIHSMDDYFMTEVEVEDNEVSKSSVRGKKSAMKTVLEYCYEPEMEEAYRSSMLKAFKKTLEEGTFTVVIVDDRNLRVADFAQFWATAKRLCYEVYLLEAPYKDPAGCTARNIHNFTQDDIEKMARQWEDAPSLYVKLDPKALFSGDDLKESNIQEVDMDMEDEDVIRGASELDQKKHEKVDSVVAEEEHRPNVKILGSSKNEKKRDVEADNPVEVKDLGQSKWSSDLDDVEDDEGIETAEGKPTALSGLFKTYGKGGKSVRWGDQAANVGFSIGSAKKSNMASLVIGPGTGYNLNSNPLRDDEVCSSIQPKKKHSVFQEQLRAEKESFRAVFDRRKHRIGGLDAEDE